MRATLITLLVVGLVALVAYLTKPSPQDFYEELQVRAAEVRGGEAKSAGLLPKGGTSLDKVVRLMSPDEVVAHTHHSDYVLLSVFTIAYPESPGVYARVYATGVFNTFLVMSEEL